MSIEIVEADNINCDFCSVLCGYHVYRKFWKLFVSQIIMFASEEKNP